MYIPNALRITAKESNMDDRVKEIVWAEGHYAYKDLVNLIDNPYNGVNETLKRIWYDAWWDAFYEDQ